jgi:hypothetical protein
VLRRLLCVRHLASPLDFRLFLGPRAFLKLIALPAVLGSF